ncbi:MAG TPA: ABC transporter permease [Thermoanaerobaculia bacterium]|jgi:ABC-2 type transport system permease protein
MNWKKTFAVIRREYIERVRTKAFWVATLLIPALFLVYIGVTIATSRKAGGERKLAVVDLSGDLYEPLVRDVAAREAEEKKKSRGAYPHWILERRPVGDNVAATKEALRNEVLTKKINAYLVLDPAALRKGEAEYYSSTVSEFIAMSALERSLNRIVLREKIASRGFPADLASDLETRVDLKAFKVTEKGAAEEKGAGIVAAIIFLTILYGTMFMYGYQVMRGVLEEKTNRIVEIIVASVRPTELMIGKILGIGLVGLTQYFVWSLVAMNLSLPGIAAIVSSGDMGMPRIPISMIGYFILYFVLGYFLYASVYTTIAAPFNTDQEAQQLAMIPMVLIISGMAVMNGVLANPSGGIAIFFSIFPFTSPLIMFLRTAISEVPSWQIACSVLASLLTTAAIAWFAGKIYRIGIFMYGKKPTIPEILRWARYTPGKAPQPAVPRAS